MKNHYKYVVEQSHFEEGNKESLKILCFVTIVCEEGELYLYIITQYGSTVYIGIAMVYSH